MKGSARRRRAGATGPPMIDGLLKAMRSSSSVEACVEPGLHDQLEQVSMPILAGGHPRAWKEETFNLVAPVYRQLRLHRREPAREGPSTDISRRAPAGLLKVNISHCGNPSGHMEPSAFASGVDHLSTADGVDHFSSPGLGSEQVHHPACMRPLPIPHTSATPWSTGRAISAHRDGPWFRRARDPKDRSPCCLRLALMPRGSPEHRPRCRAQAYGQPPDFAGRV